MNLLLKTFCAVAMLTAMYAAPAAAESVLNKATVLSTPAGCAKCCYNPCIDYRYRGHRKACCDTCGTMQLALEVKDPCTCCVVAIPVCLPACCTDCPCVRSRCALFGAGIVRYDYHCGVSVFVTFTKCGDIVVTYVGV